MKQTTCGSKSYEIQNDRNDLKQCRFYDLLNDYYKYVLNLSTVTEQEILAQQVKKPDGYFLFVYGSGVYDVYFLDDCCIRHYICQIGSGFNDDEYESLFIENIHREYQDWLFETGNPVNSNIENDFDLCIEKSELTI